MIDTHKFEKMVDTIRQVLGNSYLLSYGAETYVLLFLPEKYKEIKNLLSNLTDRCEGCCYYFKDFSVALWQDVEDAVGFQGESVCCVEFFEGEVNRNFHWRRKQTPTVTVQKGEKMQIPFRIECPHCHWGHTFKDSYINQGYLKGKCEHCGELFFIKITVTGVNVEISKELPANIPCATLPEAKDEI